jgi:Ribbon-helix-helix domain
MESAMIRKQVYIEPEQDKALKRLSSEAGVTEAALIRESIDMLLHQRLATADRSVAIRGIFGLWRDREDDSNAANRASWRRRRERLSSGPSGGRDGDT